MSQDKRLPKHQRNDVFSRIVNQGLSPTDFAFVDLDRNNYGGGLLSMLSHLGSPYYFIFDNDSIFLTHEMSPGENMRVERGPSGSWEGQLKCLTGWLGRIKREVEEPDLWETLQTGSALAGAASDSELDNTPFTESELEHVESSLGEIKQYLIEISHAGQEQKTTIENRFKYLTDAARRTGRKDWLNILYATLINLMVSLALRGDNAGDLMRFAGQIFAWLIKAHYFLPGIFGT